MGPRPLHRVGLTQPRPWPPAFSSVDWSIVGTAQLLPSCLRGLGLAAWGHEFRSSWGVWSLLAWDHYRGEEPWSDLRNVSYQEPSPRGPGGVPAAGPLTAQPQGLERSPAATSLVLRARGVSSTALMLQGLGIWYRTALSSLQHRSRTLLAKLPPQPAAQTLLGGCALHRAGSAPRGPLCMSHAPGSRTPCVSCVPEKAEQAHRGDRPGLSGAQGHGPLPL